ncbi:helix-turn-helix transcriptional regulator [Desulfobacterales bacterium HSG2]|nr:helix-turn-helix transcriptional regulator [Desulfobacterales bacterium HSG2]
MSELKMQFGRRLKQIRKQRSLTQEKLAETVGISVEFLSNMERGINAPSFKTLENLSGKLNIPVWELFKFESD